MRERRTLVRMIKRRGGGIRMEVERKIRIIA